MPNDNHEFLYTEEISTYTDTISQYNTITIDELYKNVLSGGTLKGSISNLINGSAEVYGSPNSDTPIYKLGDDNYCYSESGIPTSEDSGYIRVVYSTGGTLCTEMNVKNYVNHVEIIEEEFGEYLGYRVEVETKIYNNDGEFYSDSLLSPFYLIKNSPIAQPLNQICSVISSNYNGATNAVAVGKGSYGNAYNLTDGSYIDDFEIIFLNDGTEAIFDEEDRDIYIYNNGDNFITEVYRQNYGSEWLSVYKMYNNIDDILFLVACGGLKFLYNGTMYKPIVNGGVVTGYTNDMSEESEWDEWENIHDHVVPNTPGGGGGDSNIDKDGLNDFPLDDAGGVCKYYALDTYDLSELNSSIYVDTAGVPLNPGDFIVGLWLLPIDLSQFSSGIETIKLGTHSINASGSRLSTTRKIYDLGTKTISWHYNGTFLDYAPYTEVSVYVPYCGMVHLPTSLCMNYKDNTINVKLVVDAISGACKGIVSINSTVYTSINGSMMSTIPISAEQCATKAQTTVNACVNAISGIVGIPSYSASASSGNVDVFNKGAMTASLYTTGASSQQSYNINPVSAGVTAISSIGNSMITYNNIAPDYIAGSTDSSVNYYMPQYCKLFMSYPKVDMGDIAHTHGKVCNYQDTLNNCTGFTVVKRPHLNITCTNEERDEITSLLESGVIL